MYCVKNVPLDTVISELSPSMNVPAAKLFATVTDPSSKVTSPLMLNPLTAFIAEPVINRNPPSPIVN